LKKAKPVTPRDTLRPEYRREDFGEMVRGKYAARVKARSNVVVLTDEVARAFPTADAVNDALLSLIKIARSAKETRRQPTASGRRRVGR
jgi:hypothetical protein